MKTLKDELASAGDLGAAVRWAEDLLRYHRPGCTLEISSAIYDDPRADEMGAGSSGHVVCFIYLGTTLEFRGPEAWTGSAAVTEAIVQYLAERPPVVWRAQDITVTVNALPQPDGVSTVSDDRKK